MNAINLPQAKILWSKKFPEIYDVYVLANPTKIVVMTRDNDNLKKIVLDQHGNTLSQQLYRNIKLNLELNSISIKVRWSPPQQNIEEQIVVLEQNYYKKKSIASLYSSPWIKPLLRKDIRIEPGSYEHLTIIDIAFRAPNLVVQYEGSGIMQSQFFYKIINIRNSQESTILIEGNIQTDFGVQDGKLIITTEHNSIGSPFGPDHNKGNLVYAVYDLNTRKQIHQQVSTFTDNDTFGWNASYQAGKIWMHDLSDSKWIITDTFGKALIEEQTTVFPEGVVRFITYAPVDKKAYFIVYKHKETAKLLELEVTDRD
ncbi:hypothetical protein RQP50_19435 [Paenibacillus sp. chi10]|uniref:Uncharacterized protein n=1 Tax=Paenibacillus suaedae TaxID=3077233 RepID=A0AAJ2N5W8_9BACL|nr:MULTISPECIES: hypothetical protein [unclassified Paenibacillus]MDT8978406.1 hypothetical protein [Paenibacillus sp. chi10]GAV14243.1 hypothetical protein PBN151_4205 [Paenibacillus sp. NAIST15-1]